MAWIRRGAVMIGLVVVLLVASMPVYLLFAGWRSFPPLVGELEVEGLVDEVEVRRDGYGIPVVHAANAWDLWFAQGHVHAQDRFWEMDVRRHVTSGRLSELFGSSQVETDAFLRTLGWRRAAEADLELLDDETLHMLEAYAAGVNAWMAGRRGTALSFEHAMLPLTGPLRYQPEPWTPADSVAWIRAMAWDLAGIDDDLVRARLSATDLGPGRSWTTLYPEPPGEHPAIIADGGSVRDGQWLANATHPPEDDPDGATGEDGGQQVDGESADDPDDAPIEPVIGEPDLELLAHTQRLLDLVPPMVGRGEGIGSNSWVVSGDRTASGAPLLANDPHLEPSQPSLWYQVGLRCRPVSEACPYDVTGFSFSGLPGVVIGHTDRAAWGFTNLSANAADLVIERLDGDHHHDGDELVEVTTRTETIRVAMGRDVTVTIQETGNGPLISDVSSDAREVAAGPLGDRRDRRAGGHEHAVALRWTALQPTPTVAAIPRFARLSDWDDLLEAAALFEVPSQNIVYADVDGRIGFVPAGRVPVRERHEPREPMAAWLDEHTLPRDVGDHERPWLLDPPDGVIVAANQPVLPRSDTPVLEDLPNMGHRAARIHDLLDTDRRLTVDDMLAIQLDTHNANAATLRRHLLAVTTDDVAVTQIQQVLVDWDGHDDVESSGAAAFNAVWRHVLALTFHDELPVWARPDGSARWWEVVRYLLERPASPWWDDLTTLEVTSRDDVLEAAMAEAHRELSERFTPDPTTWRWGAMHRLHLDHATFGASGIRPFEWILNRGPFEVAGGRDVVNATGWSAGDGYEVDAVPSMRMVVDLGDLDAGRWVQLTGQSGRPFHHHYADQAHLWARGDTVPLVHSDRAVRDVHWRVLTLTPPPDAP